MTSAISPTKSPGPSSLRRAPGARRPPLPHEDDELLACRAFAREVAGGGQVELVRERGDLGELALRARGEQGYRFSNSILAFLRSIARGTVSCMGGGGGGGRGGGGRGREERGRHRSDHRRRRSQPDREEERHALAYPRRRASAQVVNALVGRNGVDPGRDRGRPVGLRDAGRRAGLEHRPQRRAHRRLARLRRRHDRRPAVRLLDADELQRRGRRLVGPTRPRRLGRRRDDVARPDGLEHGSMSPLVYERHDIVMQGIWPGDREAVGSLARGARPDLVRVAPARGARDRRGPLRAGDRAVELDCPLRLTGRCLIRTDLRRCLRSGDSKTPSARTRRSGRCCFAGAGIEPPIMGQQPCQPRPARTSRRSAAKAPETGPIHRRIRASPPWKGHSAPG